MKAALHRAFAAAAALVIVAPSLRAADTPLENAKALYASASFEDALAALGALDAAAGQTPDALEYKALCLLALGRSAEAQSVADLLVSTVPTFVPPAGDDLSPRFIALLSDTRRRLVPGIARQRFSEAREHFREKNQAASRQQFEQVLALANDPVWSDRPEAEDLRTLASGFLDLMNAPPPVVATPAAPAPAVPPTPVAAAAPPVAAAAATRPPSPGPLPVVQLAPPDRSASAGLQPAVIILQPMPTWQPPDRITATRRFNGAVRIRIGTDGRVVSAAIETPTHPDYDKLLLEAARSWLYKPAMRNGEPIEVEKIVTFSLRTN